MNVALHHRPQHSFIELLRPVCCPHDEHPVISSRLHLKPESSPTSVCCDRTRVSSRRNTSTVETKTTLTPSNSTRNSVFSLREASCSPSLLSHSKLSTSSKCTMTKDEMRELGRLYVGGICSRLVKRHKPIKMTEGCNSLATANNARTSFSPSPTCDDSLRKKILYYMHYITISFV